MDSASNSLVAKISMAAYPAVRQNHGIRTKQTPDTQHAFSHVVGDESFDVHSFSPAFVRIAICTRTYS